jgi:tetratricopeptide (TPR) repeat protein
MKRRWFSLIVLTVLFALVLVPAAPAIAQTAEEWIDRGDRHLKYEEFITAVSCYTKAIEIEPHSAVAYFKRCMAHNALGELEPAVADVSTAIELGPANYQYYYVRRFLYNIEQKYFLAVVDLDKSIALKPDVKRNGLAYFERAIAYHNLGGYDLAITDYTIYIGANPDNGEAYFLRALSYLELRDTGNAKKDFRKSCDLGWTIGCDRYDTLK